MTFRNFRGKILRYQDKFAENIFLYLDEGTPGTMGSDPMGQAQYYSYPNGRFAPRTAFVKKEGNLWITRRISSDHIWSVSDFKEKAEIVDENPNVLLVNHFVGVSRPWLEILEIQLDPELETKYKGSVFLYNKPKVLTGNVPLNLDWIKQAVIKDSILP